MSIEKLANLVSAAPHVFIIGNGGSYANAQHIANDLLSCGVRAFTFDAATYTAFANDFGFESAYARWISVVGDKADCLIALSGSGRSPNILAAIREAERIGMTVYRIFGAELGQDMQTAENHQLVVGHELMRRLRDSS